MMPSPLLRSLALACLGLGLAEPVLAKEVEARAMKYTNKGTYTAQFYIRYNLDDGSNCKVRPKNFGLVNLAYNDTVTYDLSDKMVVKDGGQGCVNAYGYIQEGREVWGYVDITYGTNEGCKKDKTVIYQMRGGTISYKTKGETLTNNRCQVSSWPLRARVRLQPDLARHPVYILIGRLGHYRQLIDILIAIAVQVDEGWNVQRQRDPLERDGLDIITEIIVAIDQDARVRRRNDRSQLLVREIGERQVHGPFNMAHLERISTARIKDDRIRLGRLRIEVFQAQQTRFAIFKDFAAQIHEPGKIHFGRFRQLLSARHKADADKGRNRQQTTNQTVTNTILTGRHVGLHCLPDLVSKDSLWQEWVSITILAPQSLFPMIAAERDIDFLTDADLIAFRDGFSIFVQTRRHDGLLAAMADGPRLPQIVGNRQQRG